MFAKCSGVKGYVFILFCVGGQARLAHCECPLANPCRSLGDQDTNPESRSSRVILLIASLHVLNLSLQLCPHVIGSTNIGEMAN
jgi:hypothetical protein